MFISFKDLYKLIDSLPPSKNKKDLLICCINNIPCTPLSVFLWVIKTILSVFPLDSSMINNLQI